ncbi:MAG: CPBP family intramembrane glutamic endopeptidase [Verrucomicrobiota bacterium]|nr:CPBP family intramembrane glutamic endopeptidase [Verrucomicrobiota bacterium]
MTIILMFICLSFLIPTKDSITFQMLSFCLFGLIISTLILWINYKKEKLSFGLSIKNLKYVIWTPLIYLITIILLLFVGLLNQYLLTNFFDIEIKPQDILEKFKELENSFEISIFVIGSAVVAPIYEELLFRGIIFPKLIQKTNFTIALLLSSLIFAVLHFHLSALLPLFVLSIILSITYLYTSTIWASISLHALFNLISIIAVKFIS